MWKKKWLEVRIYLLGKWQISWLDDQGPGMKKIRSGTGKPGEEAVEKSAGFGT